MEDGIISTILDVFNQQETKSQTQGPDSKILESVIHVAPSVLDLWILWMWCATQFELDES